MGENSKIEWTEHTWNPWQGCKKVSPACKFCYMFRDKERYGQNPEIVVRSKDPTFNKPLTWKDPAFVFTCSWSDWFIEEADEWRAKAWDIVKRTPHLTYQILTKRPERILQCLPHDWGDGYPNVWMGASVENQKYADIRIPLLLAVPALVRFLSCEPLLGLMNIKKWLGALWCCPKCGADWKQEQTTAAAPEKYCAQCGAREAEYVGIKRGEKGIHWVIAGGESGPGARPTHIEWARSLRDQCVEAKVPFFFKQWGEWLPTASPRTRIEEERRVLMHEDGTVQKNATFAQAAEAKGPWWTMERLGKQEAGRMLDNELWDQMPPAQPAPRQGALL